MYVVSKVLKVTLKESMAVRLASFAQADGLAEAEVVRRALLEYFERHDLGHDAARIGPGSGQGWARTGPGLGQDRARIRPDHGRPVSAGVDSPPSSPSGLPRTPPSLSPPLFADAPDEPPPATLLEFRCIRGKKSAGTRWFLTEQQVRQWETVYPDMDILAEARKAREYSEAHGLKTYDGMKAYLVKWFNRGQNGGRYVRRAASGSSVVGRSSRTLQEAYGYDSWEEWETTIRSHFEGPELDVEMGRLGEIRSRWEAAGAA